MRTVDENGEGGICAACYSPQPIDHLERQLKKGFGTDMPCKFCGGPVKIMRATGFESFKKSQKLKRGQTAD